MPQRKNQGKNKGEAVIELFRKRNGEDLTAYLWKNVNWATAETVEELKSASGQDFFDAIRNRHTNPISEHVIVIGPEQESLNIIYRNGLNIRDMGNPMFGEEDKTNRKTLSINIGKADPEHNKVCVVYGGDLLGEEWVLKRLNDAKIIETTISDASYQELKSIADEVLADGEKPAKNDTETVKKALYFGLGERVKVLKRDILYTLKHPGVEVYLVNGAQEEKINKYFKIDILQTVVNEIKQQHPELAERIHYIKGVNTIINVEKKNTDGTSKFATIGLLTNNSLSKARKGQQAKNAVKLNSGENMADVVFVTNTNVAGKKGPNEYYVSSESTFIETPARKLPVRRPRGYNIFSLDVLDNGEIDVTEGFMPEAKPLELLTYNEYIKNKLIRETLIRRVTKEIEALALPEGQDPVRPILQYLSKKSNAVKTDAKQAPATTPEPAQDASDEMVK
ncbi:MAG: hypothetical protein IK070_01090 [Clostridia bacterium]|nr:hypothetical protein [Clostridia bacterium]